jgi:hypothetical protein
MASHDIGRERLDESRRVRPDLTKEEREQLKRYGAIEFKSIRAPDMPVEVFVPSRTQH